jgi:8-oxo-dGTP diphosphatase
MKDKKYCYQYPHPAVTADCVVFSIEGHNVNVLLIQRGNEPYKGSWAFPGGFMNIDETAEQCAHRELEEETGIKDVKIKQVGTYSAVDRDPRERILTVAYCAILDRGMRKVKGGDDAADARWFSVDNLPPLAFDHEQILGDALLLLQRERNVI